jgi:5-methylcytosine-specific restriction endonuclease McrA
VGKAARKAKERGAKADRIDPLKVFARDRWRCHLCGKHSPENLRGSYDDRAPELDHVIPLSRGGTHTWDNVRLAHRKCNQVKSDRPLGQLMLDAFAVA